MKNILYPHVVFCCLLLMSFTTSINDALRVQDLAQKWELSHYSVGWFKEAPSVDERNDFIHLLPDMTFTSVNEGIYDKGTWALEGEKIILSNASEEESLVLIVDELTDQSLTLIIDYPDDPYIKHLKIHFKNH